MADLSKIKLNGTEYDVRDATARDALPEKVNITDIVDNDTSGGAAVPASAEIVKTHGEEIDAVSASISELATYVQDENHVNKTIAALRGSDGWTTTSGCAITFADNVGSMIGNGESSALRVSFDSGIPLTSGKIIYYRAKLTPDSDLIANLRLRMNTTDLQTVNSPEQISYILSGMFTQSNETGNAICSVYALYDSAAAANGKTISIEDMLTIDIYEVFGTDNAPTKETLDSIVESLPSGVYNGILSQYTYSKLDSMLTNPYAVQFETVEMPSTIDTSPTSRLMLIATKKDNYYNVENPPIQLPQDVGYLYLDESTDKLYYSPNVYNRPAYLCDWNAALAGGDLCKNWMPIITKDGDIVFLKQGKEGRGYPIVYPAGDYANPVKVITTETYLPAGLTTDTGACVSCYGDFFIFGEYMPNGFSIYNGEPVRIWKVSKPYTTPANWVVKDTWYYSNTGEPWGQNPTREITHFHTISYDFYTGDWYANTGDLDAFCRVLKSTDSGETWTEIESDGQIWRTLGYVFTEDACYWGCDGSPHNLYKATRDVSGHVDFTTTATIAALFDNYTTQRQRTYVVCLVREPYGLISLDRTEPGTNGKYTMQFWSFEDEKLYTLGTFESTEGEYILYGLGVQASTFYQSTQEDGIICGSSSYDRKLSIAVLNNSALNRLGVTKLKIVRK